MRGLRAGGSSAATTRSRGTTSDKAPKIAEVHRQVRRHRRGDQNRARQGSALPGGDRRRGTPRRRAPLRERHLKLGDRQPELRREARGRQPARDRKALQYAGARLDRALDRGRRAAGAHRSRLEKIHHRRSSDDPLAHAGQSGEDPRRSGSNGGGEPTVDHRGSDEDGKRAPISQGGEGREDPGDGRTSRRCASGAPHSGVNFWYRLESEMKMNRVVALLGALALVGCMQVSSARADEPAELKNLKVLNGADKKAFD